MIVLIRTGDVWAEQTFSGNQQIESLVLPGFVVRLADLWVDVGTDEPDSDQEAAGDGD